jgi:WD40 repeat protein
VAQANYTYPLTSTSLGCGGGLGPIAWSPDGAHIAATDGPDGQIIVWQVNVRG